MKAAAASVLLAAAALAACTGKGQRAGKDAPDILVVVVDSLRPDHLGRWGYARDTSPFIDRWSRGAGLYRNAYTQGTHTRISMASLFTGVLPTAHRVREVNLTPDQGATDALAEGFTTWGESLHAAGYETWGFSANPHISEVYGFTQGFEHYLLTQSDDGRTLRDALFAKLAARPPAERRPLFVYLHLMDVHSPYLPPAPWNTVFPVPRGQLVYANWAVGVTQRDLVWSISQYDGAIRSMDAILAEVIPAWESGGARRRSVVLVSDHGEEFREHGNLGHGTTVFDELARVAFVVKGPGVAPGIHDEPVSHVDANRLVLDWAGATVPKEARGRPLAAWGKSEPVLYTESKTEGGFRQGSRLVVVHRKRLWKSLYDSALDPRQQQPLPDRAAAKQLAAAMEDLIAPDVEVAARMNAPRHMKADEAIAERLRALGYVSHK